MQPYFFPYIGYWQLIHAVDKFVVYDDVNFIKKGWINRNNILLNKNAHLFTLPLSKASQNKLINEINLQENLTERQNILKTIYSAYTKAPYFYKIKDILETIIMYDELNLSLYLQNQLKIISDYLCINTEFLLSSELQNDKSLHSQDKILDICKFLNADEYINPIGGLELYDKNIFLQKGIQLYFIKTWDIEYKQFGNNFIPNLSIIDVMMFNSPEQIKKMLDNYELI